MPGVDFFFKSEMRVGVVESKCLQGWRINKKVCPAHWDGVSTVHLRFSLWIVMLAADP